MRETRFFFLVKRETRFDCRYLQIFASVPLPFCFWSNIPLSFRRCWTDGKCARVGFFCLFCWLLALLFGGVGPSCWPSIGSLFYQKQKMPLSSTICFVFYQKKNTICFVTWCSISSIFNDLGLCMRLFKSS